MKNLSLVSVVIPAYNAASYLAETLESVLDQDYPVVEILVVDDGSTDGTAEIARGFGGNVRLISQENGGVSAARNKGLAHARGELVALLDADDWWYPQCLSEKVAAMEADPGAGAVFGWVEVAGADMTPSGRVLKGVASDFLNALAGYTPPAIPAGSSNVLMRRELVEPIGGFDTALTTAADLDYWIRLAALTRLIRVDRVLGRYRLHSSNMSGNMSVQMADMERIVGKYDEDPAFPADWRGMLRRFYFSLLKHRIKEGNPKGAAVALYRMLRGCPMGESAT